MFGPAVVGCMLGKCVRQWTGPAVQSVSSSKLGCGFDAALWGRCYSASVVAVSLQVLYYQIHLTMSCNMISFFLFL